MLHDHWRGKYNSTYQVKVYRIVIYALFYGKIFFSEGGRGVLLVRIDLSKYDQGIIFFQNSRGYRTRRNSYNVLFNQQINNIIGNASNFS